VVVPTSVMLNWEMEFKKWWAQLMVGRGILCDFIVWVGSSSRPWMGSAWAGQRQIHLQLLVVHPACLHAAAPPTRRRHPLAALDCARCPAFKLLTYYGSVKERAAKRQGWSKPNAFHVCITSYTLVLQVGAARLCSLAFAPGRGAGFVMLAWGGGVKFKRLHERKAPRCKRVGVTTICGRESTARATLPSAGRAHVQAQEVEVPDP
jgi:phosphatidylglycerophosphate synthase